MAAPLAALDLRRGARAARRPGTGSGARIRTGSGEGDWSSVVGGDARRGGARGRPWRRPPCSCAMELGDPSGGGSGGGAGEVVRGGEVLGSSAGGATATLRSCSGSTGRRSGSGVDGCFGRGGAVRASGPDPARGGPGTGLARWGGAGTTRRLPVGQAVRGWRRWPIGGQQVATARWLDDLAATSGRSGAAGHGMRGGRRLGGRGRSRCPYLAREGSI